MSEYFDRIEAHLLDAVERQAAGRASGALALARHSQTRAARRAASGTLAVASVVVAVLVFIGALLIAGGGNGRQSAAPAGASPSSGGPFPLAPHTQRGQWTGGAGPCPVAAVNPYLPRHSGCVSAAIADVDGDGHPDLVVLYAQLGRRRVHGGLLPTAFTLKVVRASGRTLTTRVVGSDVNPKIMFVRNINERPGTEIFVYDGHLSSGNFVGVYSFDGQRLRKAGGFTYGGDSGQQYGFTCRRAQTGLIIHHQRRGSTATITQHEFLLQSGGANARWSERDTVFGWIGAKLQHVVTLTSTRRGSRDIGGLGFPPKNLTTIGC